MNRRHFLLAAAGAALVGCSSGGGGSVIAPPLPQPAPAGPIYARIDPAPYVARRAQAIMATQARVDSAAVSGLAVTPSNAGVLRVALAAGMIVDGAGQTFTVDEPLDMVGGALLHCRLVNANPSPIDACVLRTTGDVVLASVVIDRGGDGTGGSHEHAAALLVQNGDVVLEMVSIVGSNQGAGIKAVACRGTMLNCSVADSTAVTTPTDDVQDGIWLNACSGLNVISPVIARLRTDAGQGPMPVWSRGLTISGGSDILVTDFDGQDVDQHIDISGDEAPNDITILGGRALRGRNFGVKAAVTAHGVRVINFTADSIARAGLYVGGDAYDVTWQGCTAVNCGAGAAIYGVAQSYGYRIETNGDQAPHDVLALDCANSGGLTTAGFENDLPGLNHQDGCVSSGSSGPEFVGF